VRVVGFVPVLIDRSRSGGVIGGVSCDVDGRMIEVIIIYHQRGRRLQIWSAPSVGHVHFGMHALTSEACRVVEHRLARFARRILSRAP
jgi:hypothetical protein